LRALHSRHFPQPVVSTVVAPSGGVQRTTYRERGNGHRTTNPPKIWQDRRIVTSTEAPILCFLAVARHRHASVSGVVQSLMGCKRYARMLGLSRGYPYILYLSLSKWDAAPFVPFFHKATFGRETRWHIAAVPPRICHCSCFSVACQVAVQNLRAAHASISARAEVRRFRSEREKFRLSSRGHFSTAGPMAT
jgi:hypothetical protein